MEQLQILCNEVIVLIIIMTTVETEKDADRLSKELVENKLAACVSVFPVRSTYYWMEKIVEKQPEFLLIIKTLEEKVSEAIKYLKENHPYSVPEIVTIKAEAHGKYVDWMLGYLLGLEFKK